MITQDQRAFFISLVLVAIVFYGCKPEKEKPVSESPVQPLAEKLEGEIIADDEGPQFEIVSGKWNSSAGNGSYGNIVHWAPRGTGNAEVQWTIEIPTSGNYEIFARWTENRNRATDTPYKIQHAGGVDTVRVDQEKNGGEWKSLGVFNFSKDSPAVIAITDEANDHVIADAVKLVPR